MQNLLGTNLKVRSAAGVYLDNAASTPILPTVWEAMSEGAAKCFANASSLHGLGYDARAILEECRRIIACSVRTDCNSVIFTSGATESNNTFCRFCNTGNARARRIITLGTEHPSMLVPLSAVGESGVEVVYVDVDGNGRMLLESLESELQLGADWVSVSLVNSETGVVQDMEGISRLCREYSAKLFSDLTQGYLKVPVDFGSVLLDAFSFSSHKVHGPKGVGVLVLKDCSAGGCPVLLGGGQEFGIRAGTENVLNIFGFSTAVEALMDSDREYRTHLDRLKVRLLRGLRSLCPDLVVNGLEESASPSILNVSLCGYEADEILSFMNARQVFASAGSACSGGGASRVLSAMRVDDDRIRSAVRFSFGAQNSLDDIDKCLNVVSLFLKRKLA